MDCNKITIGSNVKKIEKGAFANCRKLASINMKKANGITSIGSKAFSRINSKAKVSVPSKKLSKYTRMLKKAGLPKKYALKAYLPEKETERTKSVFSVLFFFVFRLTLPTLSTIIKIVWLSMPQF